MKKIIILTLAISIIGGFYYAFKNKNLNITSENQAISLIKEKYPEYGGYPSDNLPPKSIEILDSSEGWLIGMYVEGSGQKGILKANCFSVSRSKEVREIGFFQGEGPANAIDISTCTPKE